MYSIRRAKPPPKEGRTGRRRIPSPRQCHPPPTPHSGLGEIGNRLCLSANLSCLPKPCSSISKSLAAQSENKTAGRNPAEEAAGQPQGTTLGKAPFPIAGAKVRTFYFTAK